MRLGGSRGNSGQFGNGPLGIIKSRNREKITPQASLVWCVCLIDWLIWSIDSSIDRWMTGWMDCSNDELVHWLISCLINCLIDWLIDRLIDWLTKRLLVIGTVSIHYCTFLFRTRHVYLQISSPRQLWILCLSGEYLVLANLQVARVSAKFEFRYESLKIKFSVILFV